MTTAEMETFETAYRKYRSMQLTYRDRRCGKAEFLAAQREFTKLVAGFIAEQNA